MYNLASQAYQKTSQATVDPRELEASLLLKAAARLQAIRDDFEARAKDLDPALTYNRKLWTILVTSATKSENPLPREIKQNIATLGVFIFNHTIQLMIEPRAERLAVLVNINKNIAEGLRQRR
ncbi:MAG: flagellar biosynthesis regulator FlaF [Hyphomicrobiaceae bacterium]|nr:flagellar biosynthesis regulator FlaF [Hyphomicrobiaceae bacterium]